MTNLSASLVSALYNLQLMKLIGADGVAAYGVLMYVGFIFAAVFIGYAQGCAPIISYHYGAENHDELKNLFRKSITMLAIAGVAMFASAQLMATPLAKMFVGYDAGLMELTEHALKLYAFSFPLCGFNIFSSAFFTALTTVPSRRRFPSCARWCFRCLRCWCCPWCWTLTASGMPWFLPRLRRCSFRRCCWSRTGIGIITLDFCF